VAHRSLLLLAVVAGFAACDGLSPQRELHESKDPGSGPIVIGHFGSMTGSEATFGQSTDKGVRLAIEERNAAGGVHGRPVELVTLDDRLASAARKEGFAIIGS